LVSAFENVLVIVQPGTVSQTVAPDWSSKLQTHDNGATPVDCDPSRTAGLPVTTPEGAVQIAFAGVGVGVGVGGVGVGVGDGVGVGVGVEVGSGVVPSVRMPRWVPSLPIRPGELAASW
jgi:hypothetical protein